MATEKGEGHPTWVELCVWEVPQKRCQGRTGDWIVVVVGDVDRSRVFSLGGVWEVQVALRSGVKSSRKRGVVQEVGKGSGKQGGSPSLYPLILAKGLGQVERNFSVKCDIACLLSFLGVHDMSFCFVLLVFCFLFSINDIILFSTQFYIFFLQDFPMEEGGNDSKKREEERGRREVWIME